jgi:hypothetical protein
MSAVEATSERHTIQVYARVAGVLFLLSLVGGGFGEAYVPLRLIVHGDAAATAENLRSSAMLHRLGFTAYLIEALCDVTLAWLLYVVLRPVHRELALLSVFFGLVATALYGVAELFYFTSSLVVQNAASLQSFTAGQRNELAMLSLRVYSAGSSLFLAFYGVPTLLRGYLIFRSGFLPKFLGVLMMVSGVGFILKNFLFLLAPKYASNLLLVPVALAGVSLTVWFLTKGVDVPRWKERAAAAGG